MKISSEKFLNIITHSPSALLILTPEFEIIHASHSYLQATMADKRNIVGKNIFEAFPDNPDDPQANGVRNLKASLKEVLKTREPQKMPIQKYDVPRLDGTFEEKFWKVVNVPVIGEDQQIEHIIHSVADVTDQVKTEAALELAVGAAQLGTWEIDLIENSFIHRNLRHDKIYGYEKPQPNWSHEMARQKILTEDVPVYDKAFSEATKTGYIDLEVRIKWEDGSIHWMEVKGKVYYTSKGKPSKAAGVNIDVTEQRLVEEALREAKEEAESAAMAKEEFLSTMSHEIRTPLNAVIGLSNLLLDDHLTAHQKSNLDSLHFAASNLLHLVNNVLDFSKIRAGKIDVTKEDFDLNNLIYKLIKIHQPKATTKNVELVCCLEQKTPGRICSDPFILSQILNNLIGNALKFTDKGRICVSAETSKEEKGERWLKISVEDTGKGIAPDKLDFIFEKFSQQRSFSDGNYEGTGLGLPITKALVEILGGNIEVSSTPGKGSKFSFTMPKIEASLWVKKETRPKEGQELTEDFNAKNLLLVEDVEINRNIILQYLKKWWNVVPDEAENGAKALEMIQEKNYDLILMDLRMPVMDGYEASKMIRKFDSYRKIPILAFTADTRNNRKYSGLFNDIIYKPFEPGDLKYKIQKHLMAPENIDRLSRSTEDNEMGVADLSSFNIWRYTKIAEGKPEMLKKFISVSVKAFEKYKENFLAVKDEAALSDLIHRNTMNVYYINAVGLQEKIEKFRSSLTYKYNQENLHDQKREIVAEFHGIIKGLEELLLSLTESEHTGRL
ncbi:ATP-binding protein [Salinimicrobium sp. GXAS 041]|uniref:ATP-binding protein n=1 Tax=Salinimicrobium sp. GXAS 041 TaxID=3400806 RepID=UPI003C79094C